jgi:seryl-tRNA synthetase
MRYKSRSVSRRRHAYPYNCGDDFIDSSQAKENADDLLAEKRAIDAQVDAKRKDARDAELAMRQKASTIGNIVNKSVPVSQTEVC